MLEVAGDAKSRPDKGRSAQSLAGQSPAKAGPGQVLVLIGVADVGIKPEDKTDLHPDILILLGRGSKREK